jgi:hypothetical protein
MSRVFCLGVALAVLPVAAGAGPIGWDGNWDLTDQNCSDPVTYDGARISSNASDCSVTGVQPLLTRSAWEVRLHCVEEARSYDSSRVVLPAEGGAAMWVWFGPGGNGPVLFRRCP